MNTPLLTLLTTVALLTLSACGSSGTTSEIPTKRLKEVNRSFANGSVETVTTDYTESGHILRQVFRRDGNIYLTTTFDTSSDGRFTRRSEDTDQDGVEDQSSTYGYSDGLGLSRIYRIGSNTLIDEVDIFQFQGDLAVSRISRDIDEVATPDLVDETSGTVVAERFFSYENGRISVNDIDTDGDGEIDRQESFTYNPDGTLASTVFSSVTDGVISSSSFVYETGVCDNNSGNSSTLFFCVTIE